MSLARSDLASQQITLVKIENFDFRRLESLWSTRYVGVIHLTREEVFVYDCTLELNKHWKDPSGSGNRSQILEDLLKHKDLNIQLSPNEWTVFYTYHSYDRNKRCTIYEDRYFHNCPSLASHKVSWWLATFMEKIRYNALKLKFESQKYDPYKDSNYLPTNQKLYQQCRFFTETELKKSFPKPISTLILEYNAHAIHEDPTASLQQKDKEFISHLGKVVEPKKQKLDTSSESTMPDDTSKYYLSGMLSNCIEKGYVTVKELDDLYQDMPWIIHALCCFNINKAVCDRSITIAQLKKLTPDQTSTIEYKLTGAALKEEVEKFVRTNTESVTNRGARP